MRKQRPNMRDVARQAGVSLSAVSLVVNGKPGVSPEIREHVQQIISNLGYKNTQTNDSAASQAVGLLIEKSSMPVIVDSFYGEIIRGFQTEAQRMGYHIVLSMFDRNVDNLDELCSSLESKVKGLVIANDGDITAEMIGQLQAIRIPLVLVENHILNQKIPTVIGDNFMAGYKIMRHVLDCGHESIAVLRGPTKYSSLVHRLLGIYAAAGEAGKVIPPEWMPKPVSGHPHKGYMQMQEILRLPERPTAVVAISDKTALGAMEAVKEHGLRIPEDISIVSIDDIAESAYTRPPLTTIRIPKYEMGVVAFDKLQRLMLGESELPVQSVVYSDLIVRESCLNIKQLATES
ncbi:MAG: LacI family DNA-binding transcriptional regulator [Anaerolineaceae bacterium]|nr:LacI family DNA-binding transcriptional regulator [Anaerolineaceae bacterium]